MEVDIRPHRMLWPPMIWLSQHELAHFSTTVKTGRWEKEKQFFCSKHNSNGGKNNFQIYMNIQFILWFGFWNVSGHLWSKSRTLGTDWRRADGLGEVGGWVGRGVVVVGGQGVEGVEGGLPILGQHQNHPFVGAWGESCAIFGMNFMLCCSSNPSSSSFHPHLHP